MNDDVLDPTTAVAIIGMAGRFPGAPDVDALWALVRDGSEGITDVSDEEFLAAGVPAEVLRQAGYVKRTGALADVEGFDAAFFGIGSRDAALMDPQHRHFYECAWAALESGGHVPERFEGTIGVFGGCGHNTYLLHNLLTSPGLLQRLGWFLLRHTANDKDFLTTGASYRLDLHGPSINVQTACSTSLVAVHLAVQSLLSLECDLALAGGATIEVPHRVGYHYQEGEILSPDGRCRAFDAESGGTVLTSGVGVVALRRLTDALEDGDPILAVIRGSAVNNDGAGKVSYLAPSVDGHAAVVREALGMAGVDAATITLLEAHGTGTRVGDPIEVAALTAAFRDATDATGYCWLGSTKPNIGHLDTAAGVASLIKAVQALRHRYLPPMANFTAPSELLGLESTPFVLSGKGAEWEAGPTPRRAGVSSLGVGGTNAHVVLEEAPTYPSGVPARGPQLLLVSARSAAAAENAADRLADHLDAGDCDGLAAADLADVAHTLVVGRRRFEHRRAVAASAPAEASARLRGEEKGRRARGQASDRPLDVIFALPGGGSQYAGMAGGLLRADGRFTVFQESLEEIFDVVCDRAGTDLRPLLSADAAGSAVWDEALRHPTASLPAVFAVEVALARQLMAWGVKPRALVGHSLGEYAAAHLADVFTLGDAVELVVRRSELMARMSAEGGAMATVSLGEQDLAEQLGDRVSLAVVNADDECVVSGPVDAVEALLDRLTRSGVDSHRIPLAAAAHSSLLDPILPEFAAIARGVTFHRPTIPYVSNLTGTWITPEQATDPEAWARHLRRTVRFHDCLTTALEEGDAAVIEVGPGRTLSSYARRLPSCVAAVPTLRHVNEDLADDGHLLSAMGQLWVAGVDARWEDVAASPGRRRKVPLPTYPFERTRHWIEPGEQPHAVAPTGAAAPTPAAASSPAQLVRRPLDAWIEAVTWQPVPTSPATAQGQRWLLVGDEAALGAAFADALRSLGADVELTSPTHVEITPDRSRVVLFGPTAPPPVSPDHDLALAQERWLTVGLELVRAAGELDSSRVGFVTTGAWTLPGDEPGRAAQALAVGPAAVARTEYPQLSSLAIDLAPVPTPADLVAAAAELVGGSGPVLAIRDGQVLEPTHEHLPRGDAVDASPAVAPGSTWLVTGGLGAVGAAIARQLATGYACPLVVTVTAPLPEDELDWRRRHGPSHPTTMRLKRLAMLRATGVPVRVEVCDTAAPDSVRALLDRLESDGVRPEGVVHNAGALADRPIALLTPDEIETVIGAKARGALVLADEMSRRGGGTLVLSSSTSTILGPEGQTTYVAANSVLDALAGQRGSVRVVTLQWGVWAGEGMAAEAAQRATREAGAGQLVDHPVLHELFVDRAGTVVAFGALSNELWTIDQHRLAGGTALLPGTAALELMFAALAFGGAPDAPVADVTLLAPLVVADGTSIPIRVVIDPHTRTPTREIRLDADLESDGVWRTYVVGTVGAATASSAAPSLHSRREADLPASRFPVAVEDLLAGPGGELRLGARWRVTSGARRGQDEAVAFVTAEDPEGWRFDPAVADLAVAAGVALLPTDGLWVPAAVERAAVTPETDAPHLVHAKRRPEPNDADTAVVDLTIAARSGAALLRIDGLTLRRLPASTSLAIADPPPPLPRQRAVGGSLLSLALGDGIRPAEGGTGFVRALALDVPRLVISSVALEDLAHATADTPTTPKPASTGARTLEIVTSLWEDLLGLDEISPDDDFFDLGGHSLIAVRVVAGIHKQLGVRLPLTALVESPTPATLAAATDASLRAAGIAPVVREPGVSGGPPDTDATPRPLVPLRPTGSRRPFFIVHGAGGNVLNLQGLARTLPPDRPVWGLQAHGNDGLEAPDPTIEAMAARYLAAIRHVQSSGPYVLGGYSGGGIVALEMARQAAVTGDRVELVVMFDTFRPGQVTPTTMGKLSNVAYNVREYGGAGATRFALAAVQRRLRGEPVQTIEGPEEEIGLYREFDRAVLTYQFTSYPTDALLLHAAPTLPSWRRDYSWPEITGQLRRRKVAGDHVSMFSREHTGALAAIVAEALDATER